MRERAAPPSPARSGKRRHFRRASSPSPPSRHSRQSQLQKVRALPKCLPGFSLLFFLGGFLVVALRQRQNLFHVFIYVPFLGFSLFGREGSALPYKGVPGALGVPCPWVCLRPVLCPEPFRLQEGMGVAQRQASSVCPAVTLPPWTWQAIPQNCRHSSQPRLSPHISPPEFLLGPSPAVSLRLAGCPKNVF